MAPAEQLVQTTGAQTADARSEALDFSEALGEVLLPAGLHHFPTDFARYQASVLEQESFDALIGMCR